MKTRGMRTFGALFLVLLFLMGAWVVHPGWSVQAQQGKPIQGIIGQDGDVSIVPDATVTLTNVHTLENRSRWTGGVSGGKLYKFTDVAPGYYSIKVTASGYFDNGTKQPFRYDGYTLLEKNFNLTKWPDRDTSMDVLVTDTLHAAHNESVYFPRHVVSAEQTVETYSGGYVTLAKTPVVRMASLTYDDFNTKEHRFLSSSEYKFPLSSQWDGKIKIENSTLAGHLAEGSPIYSLKAEYTYTSTTGQLNHTPVAELPYTVFKNSSVWDQSSGDWAVEINLGTLTINRNLIWGLDSVSMRWDSTEGLSGARVTLVDPITKQVIDGKNSNTQGWANFSVWTGDWTVWASKATYETTVKSFHSTGNQTVRVALPTGVYVEGFISDRVIGWLDSNTKTDPVAYLYNTEMSTSPARKVVKATMKDDGSFLFGAYPGRFKLIVDADWHKASVTDLVIGTAKMSLPTIFLDVSAEEHVNAVMAYKEDNWSLMNVYQNYTLNRDSEIPWLKLSYLRDAFLQIDYSLGDGDGELEQDEVNTFAERVQQNGSWYINTDDLLTTNGYMYLSNEISNPASADTEYSVTTDIDLTEARTQPVWINTTTLYTVKKDDSNIPYMKPRYYVNFTGAWDTNTTVYRNNSYVIDLPRRYEMTETTSKSAGLDIFNFTRIELDPEIGTTGSPTANMIVLLSANGTARARVKGPAGYFQELNTSLDNYTAVVMADYNITYSADQSTDPIGDINDANFTWFFGITDVYRYGMDVVFNYTNQQATKYDNCNLTIREAGGNYTYRTFHIIVDNTPPIARLWTNRSVGGPTAHANGTTISVNESTLTRFDSLRSIDKTYLTYDGTIASAHWDFDGDGIEDSVQSPGKIVNHSFEKPGNFTLKMWVFDSVGHRSVNATMLVIVNDTSPPTVNFVTYSDKEQTTVATQYTEGVEIFFNASSTTDNYDSIANLSFRWDWGDGKNTTWLKGYDGYNISHTYDTFNNSYELHLNVTDTGFLGNEPNYYNLTKSMTVQAATSKRPSIMIKAGTFSADPSSAEEGQDVKITVTVNNGKSNGRASNVGVKLSVRTGSTWSEVSISPKFYNNSLEVNNSLEPGQDKQITFVWKADIPGTRSLRVTVTDPEEPYTWASDNSIEGTVSVREAGWKVPAIVFGIIFVIFGVPILWYVYKRYRAGELKLPRRQKKSEEEEPEKEEVEKKEKKRL